MLLLFKLQTESETQTVATTGHKTDCSYAAECISTLMQKARESSLLQELCYR